MENKSKISIDNIVGLLGYIFLLGMTILLFLPYMGSKPATSDPMPLAYLFPSLAFLAMISSLLSKKKDKQYKIIVSVIAAITFYIPFTTGTHVNTAREEPIPFIMKELKTGMDRNDVASGISNIMKENVIALPAKDSAEQTFQNHFKLQRSVSDKTKKSANKDLLKLDINNAMGSDISTVYVLEIIYDNGNKLKSASYTKSVDYHVTGESNSYKVMAEIPTKTDINYPYALPLSSSK